MRTRYLGCLVGLLFAFTTTLSFALHASPSPLPSLPPVQGIHWHSEYSQAIAKSQAQGKPLIILFTGTQWCPACMQLERDVLANPQFTRALANRFVFLKAEFPDRSFRSMQRSPYYSLMTRYDVQAFPTLVVINEKGDRLHTVSYQGSGVEGYIQELISISKRPANP